MMARDGANVVIDRYNSLSVPDQMVLQALSALMCPAAAHVVTSCLIKAGCRESQLRAFSPQNVLTRLARLAKEGFVRERPSDPKAPRNRLWQCHPETGEVALRHAFRDGRFLPFARAVANDSARHRLRLAFHAGDWAFADREFKKIVQESPGEAGLFLAGLATLQVDDSWRRGLATPAFAGLLAAALNDLALGLGKPGILEGIAREALAKRGPEREWDDLVVAQVGMFALRGKTADAEKTSGLAHGTCNSLLAGLIAAMAAGKEEAAAMAANLTAERRTRFGSGEIVAPDIWAFWQVLAFMTNDSPEAVRLILRCLATASISQHPISGALSCLRHAF
ncbi:MAG: hypothetical protein LBE84_03240, partial [Planctomycetota bacterium]|nr:hypothetical protein [Planctomycetota bacterium]